MAQLGGLEGLIKDLQAEGSAMLCATGRFIGSPICSLLENLGGKSGSLPIWIISPSSCTHFPSRKNLHCLAMAFFVDGMEGRIFEISTNTRV